MTTRNELAEYNNQRLRVEGVLIAIDRPNKKNRYNAGLVFGSVNLPHQDIELDHIVIAVSEGFINRNQLELFKKYSFTAKVGKYFKRKRRLNMLANVTAYHLQDLNENRFEQMQVKKPKEFSKYLITRISKLYRNHDTINISKLNELLLDMYEGEREEYINNLNMTTLKRSVTHADIIDELY